MGFRIVETRTGSFVPNRKREFYVSQPLPGRYGFGFTLEFHCELKAQAHANMLRENHNMDLYPICNKEFNIVEIPD